MSKRILPLILFLIFLIVSLILLVNKTSNISKPIIENGKITNLSSSTLTIKSSSDNKTKTFQISPQTKTFSLDNKPVSTNQLKKGFDVSIQATISQNHSQANTVKITNQPNILVYNPQDNDQIGLNIYLSGSARVFENTFTFRLKNLRTSKIYAESSTITNSPDPSLYGDFNFNIDYSGNAPDIRDQDPLLLEVFQSSPKDGSEIDKVSINLKYQSQNNQSVNLFFVNPKLSQNFDCSKTFPVQRAVVSNQNLAKSVIESLIQGPNDKEMAKGYSTKIDPQTKINFLNLDNGQLKIDFSNSLLSTDSCTFQSIKSQITQTLKTLPGINNIVLSVNNSPI